MATDVLVVDDEADISRLVADILADEGYSCRIAGDGESAIQAIEEWQPEVIVLDIWLEGSRRDGMAILEHVREHHPDRPVIMISGHGNIATAVQAIKLGAYDFIEKPFDADRLLLTVRRARELALLRRENGELLRQADLPAEIVGDSAAARQLRAALGKVAPTDSRVLISGPPGSGKEVFARQTHRLSARAANPFVVLNCAALASDRVEAELFGEGRSPATGRARVGTLEKAHRGTLLLDEICDMPYEAQGKIVRMLHDRSFARVGGDTLIDVDVRVIASTSRDMEAEMAAGRFREDLFYRLNVVPIRVAPLSERRDDVPALAAHFMARAATATGLAPRALSRGAMAVLQAHDWPGNVRQLKNVVNWILIMAPGDPGTEVAAEDLPPDVREGGLPPSDGPPLTSLPLKEAREVFERRYLSAQLSRFGGRISRTARFVGMNRAALHRKLKALGIGGPETSGRAR